MSTAAPRRTGASTHPSATGGFVKQHGDHDPLPYDGHNADLAHLCQICGAPVDQTLDAPTDEDPA